MTGEQWVVTYKYEPRAVYGETPCVAIQEFFRGDRAECVRIAHAFGGGEHDRVRCKAWEIIVGPASEWDQLLEDE